MPTDATLAEIEARYQRDHQVDGVTFTRWRHPDGKLAYDSGADNALYTGFYLAAASFRYSCEPTLANLDRVHSALRGVELLTTVTGTPGVLVRLAFPLAESWERIGYDPVKSLTHAGNTWGERMREGWIFENFVLGKHWFRYPSGDGAALGDDLPSGASGYMFATRTSRDQLVGVVAGLAAAHVVLSKTGSVYPFLKGRCLGCIERVTGNLHKRLEQTRFSLRDHTGRTHGTRAHRVRRPLRHALRLLDHRVNGTPLRGSLKWLYRWPFAFTWYYRWTRSTFAWNLRLTTGLTLWLLGEKDAMLWISRCWSFVDHGNPWFRAIATIWGQHLDDYPNGSVAEQRLEQLSQRGYGGFFQHQKDWPDWGAPDRIGPGIDVLLPAWLAKWAAKGDGGEGGAA